MTEGVGYDLARMSFGGTIRLVEHFRCVPDIIQFSNFLCYNGEIKALREAGDTHLYPHLIAYRTQNGVAVDKVNQIEAKTVASLIVAACEMPEYADLSFGVISLVGVEQALYVDELLRRKLSLSEYQKRELLCGSASQFQGDERDVMLLSVVDSPEGRAACDASTRRVSKDLNVAASRARDQLWVIHSLNPDTDLKAGDLRRRLIKHAEDPSALRKQYDTGERRTDSEFERLVLAHLTGAGTGSSANGKSAHLASTWSFLVMKIEKLLSNAMVTAITHLEQLGKDLEHQMILERLGWRFVRIRGSEFFKNQEHAMKRVLGRLSDLGIAPIGPKPADAGEEARSDELKNRVIRRAEEIRKHWEENPDEPDPKPVRRGRTWGQKKKQVTAENVAAEARKAEPPAPSANISTPIEAKALDQVGVVSGDAAILDQVCLILKESKVPMLARDISDKLAKRGITISKQALNQILWNKQRATHQDLKVDDAFRWSLGSK